MGLFDRQKNFRGEKLTEAFPEGERFVLWDLALVLEGTNQIVEGTVVDKVELIVSSPDRELFLASTLSKPIVEIAKLNLRDSKGASKDKDLPYVVSWKRVDTKNSYDNQATVLEMHSHYEGKEKGDRPEFSFSPITYETNPLTDAA